MIHSIGYVKLGGYASKRKKEKKEITKGDLISEGSLQVEGVFFVLFFLINLFIFGCVGSSFLCEGFL